MTMATPESEHHAHHDRRGGSLRIAITGATGLIGNALSEQLAQEEHQIVPLVRREPEPGTLEVHWDPDNQHVDASSLEGVQAVVHLAGENIADSRWTDKKKAAIRDSRVSGTTLLSQALAQLDPKPKVFISASAIGFYGDRGEEPLTEESPVGAGFLAEVSQQWEQATQPAAAAGIRVVNLRIGVVLSRDGGALAKMLGPFKAGMGGKVGSGKQYMSWISLVDIVGAVRHCLTHAELSGPVNGTAPNPVTNAEFTKTLGEVLGRPTFLSIPAAMARIAFGEMADEMLIGGCRVLPNKLQASGYRYHHPWLRDALEGEL
jgi:uncharacterized protein (TIGR01777 family)